MRYEAILFDFDGVLADTEPIHHACWFEILKPYGIHLDWDTYQSNCVGLADRSMLHFLSLQATPPLPFDELWAQYPKKKDLFRRRLESESPIPQATVEFVKSLSHYKLAVVTSSGRSEVEPVLERSGLLPQFQALVCGEDVQRHKPAPDPYLLAAANIGVRSALVVEDSQAGIASGKAAGFEVVQITSPDRMAAMVRDVLR